MADFLDNVGCGDKRPERPVGSFYSSLSRVGRFFSAFAYVLLLVVVIRSFIFQTYHIPSGSMKSTLLEGDYIFVTKYSYGFGPYSVPFGIPGWTGKFFSVVPNAGDVVVFRPSRHPGVNYVKRVIGLPGDKVQIIKGVLYINGKEMKREFQEDFNASGASASLLPAHLSRYREYLYNGTSHEILDTGSGESALDNTPVYSVPKGSIFVLGDNRSRSRDSRFLSDVGFVPLENVVGKVRMVILSFDEVGADVGSGRHDLSIFGFKLRVDRIFHHVE